MTDTQRMSDAQLMGLIDLKMALRNGQPKPAKEPKPDKPKWSKVSAAYEVRDGQLCMVEQWRKNGVVIEKIEPCKTRVTYEGKQVSVSILKHYLMTGEWIKRVAKPLKPFKAVVYSNGKALHLGYFASEDERKEAIFLHKLGFFTKKV